ncbi:unnamed protein product [Clonostachys rosea f. rosea IK726]|uniref:GH16 domain-containing protein n=2 Tax=Bionectria ochroleuca TaxID=29856 RepID=A0A0B7JNQ6_BIOOC|nr:unnamed protein product [Clonostachys rosea f. rosea IK726]
MLLKLYTVAQLAALAFGQTTLIPSDSFSSFDSHWNYLYPWGTDHNGGARMDKSQVSTAQGYLTLTSKPVTGQPPAHHGGKDIPINYLSGAIHAKKTFTVQAGGGFDFSADFLAPVDKGTWPAFWLTAVKGWPPEIDVAEWKGSGDISFNTFNTSSQVTARDVPYSNPKAWHTVRAEIRDANGRDVSVSFYLDNKWVATQYGSNYVDAGLYFIINYQMEGSSGSPGPSTTTTYSVRNVKVISYNP